MGEPLLAQSGPGILLIGATFFVILFSVILTTLRQAEVFPRGANVTLAICASLLAMIGIMRTFGQVPQAARNSGGSWPDALVLPYTAMAIAMLLVLLLLLLRKAVWATKERIRRANGRFPAEHEERARTEYKKKERCEITRLRKEQEVERPM